MTSTRRSTPFRIPITFQRKNGLILFDELRMVDWQRLVKRFGTAKPETLTSALDGLLSIFAP